MCPFTNYTTRCICMSTSWCMSSGVMGTMSDDRLIRLHNLRSLNMGPTELSRRFGRSVSYWSDMLNDRKSFGEDVARDIEEKACLPRHWMDTPQTSLTLKSATTEVRADGHVIRQYDTGGAMGGGLVLHDQPGLIHSWNVSQEWLRLNVKHYTSPKNLCIVTGFGDSMRPVFNPGDPLLVDVGVTKVDFDGMYFFRVGEEGFIKRLQRVPGEGLRVISANKDNYEPWTIKPDMDFQVLGRVIKVWRGEEF